MKRLYKQTKNRLEELVSCFPTCGADLQIEKIQDKNITLRLKLPYEYPLAATAIKECYELLLVNEKDPQVIIDVIQEVVPDSDVEKKK